MPSIVTFVATAPLPDEMECVASGRHLPMYFVNIPKALSGAQGTVIVLMIGSIIRVFLSGFPLRLRNW